MSIRYKYEEIANETDKKIYRYCLILSMEKSRRLSVFQDEVYITQAETLDRARIMIERGYRSVGGSFPKEYASVLVCIEAFDICFWKSPSFIFIRAMSVQHYRDLLF